MEKKGTTFLGDKYAKVSITYGKEDTKNFYTNSSYGGY